MASTPSPGTSAGAGPAAEPVVAVRDVWKRFGRKEAARGVSLDVLPRQIHVIMGPSGCGKSVLLKHLVGLIRPDRGEVVVFGEPVHVLGERALDALRIRIGVVFQSAALFDSLTVGDNVAFPMRRHTAATRDQIAHRVRDLLAMVELAGTEDLMPASLSGGMRKRVGIARALALNPSLILYDEPVSGLDPLTAHTVDRLILRLRDELSVTAVVVTHSIESALRVADRLSVMEAGQILASGTTAEILRSQHPFVRRFLEARAVEVPSR